MPKNRFQYKSSAAELIGKRVLVVGHRPAIADVLERLAIPFAVWHDKAIKKSPACLHYVNQPFAETRAEIVQFVQEHLSGHGPFTHVIAGTEASVFAASICRRVLNARSANDSIALNCSDKQQMKLLMQAHKVPMTDFLIQGDEQSPEFVFAQLGPKVVIKQRINSGGRGLSIATSAQAIASRTEPNLLYEKFIAASEMSIETFVRGGKIQFTSTTSYLVKSHANIVPANVPAHVLDQAHCLNRKVIETLQLDWGLTHAEFYWTDDAVLFGEVALRPPGGYIMECISLAHHFDAWEAFVANELELPYAFGSPGTQNAGVALMHAGEGVVIAVENEDAARQLPSCVRLRVLLAPGDKEEKRIGVSEVSAYALFVSDSAATTEADVRKCLDLVKFTMLNSNP